MKNINSKAFTMIELVFVIVVIGILAGIAIPKFAKTSVIAHTAKASSQLAAVRVALSTERQKRILRGDTGEITSLGATGDVFTTFSAAADGSEPDILQYPVTKCTNSVTTACWKANGGSPASYTYYFADSGDAKFKLDNNRLVCLDNTADCAKLEN